MATAKNPLKGLHVVRSKGRTYCYAWRGGPQLKAEPGTRAFLEEFLAARSPHIDTDKFGGWVQKYRGSHEYIELSAGTKKKWAPILDEVQTRFGVLPARIFDNPKIKHDIRQWRDQFRETRSTADAKKAVLSRVCAYMVSNGALSSNPCTGIENIYTSDRSDIIWLPQQLQAMLNTCSRELGEAAQLAALTGMRQSDCLSLRWSDVNDLSIEIKTGKSQGTQQAIIPLTKALRALLDGIPKRALTVLTNSYGEPWGSGFGKSWDRAMEKAGLKESGLHFHDFKGTAVTNFYRAGFTTQEIADVVGWSREAVERIINKYLKRDELLRDRIRRMEDFHGEQERLENKSVKLAVKL